MSAELPEARGGTVRAPCGSCAHEPVCSLRVTLVRSLVDRMNQAAWSDGPPPPISIEVFCRFYLEAELVAKALAGAQPWPTDPFLGALDPATAEAAAAAIDRPELEGEAYAAGVLGGVTAERVAELEGIVRGPLDTTAPELTAAAVEQLRDRVWGEGIIGGSAGAGLEGLAGARASAARRGVRRPAWSGVGGSPPPVHSVEISPEPRPVSLSGAATPRPSAPLEPAKLICEPGCGGAFGVGAGYAAHRRACPDWAAYRGAHVVELPGVEAAAPMPDGPDPDTARADFAARRDRGARAALNRSRTIRDADR